MKFYISSEVHKKFLDVGLVLLPVYEVTVERGKKVLSEQALREQLNKLSEKEFFGQEMFVAFRDFYDALGLGAEAGLPSVENLYRRYLETGKLAQINNVVDVANKVAVETLVPTGVFDMATIKGDLTLRFSRQGEGFKPLGGGVEALPEGVVVIADEEKILNRFPYRDSDYAKITEKTKDVLILGDVVAGVSQEKTQGAVEQVGKLLEEIAGGRRGRVFYSEEVETGAIEGVGVLRKKVKGEQKRVLSGIRATGRLHLGNYLGAVKGMLALQDDPNYEMFFAVVDVHAMTTPYDKESLAEKTREVVRDYLAAGLDINKSHVLVQSKVADLHAELMFYFSTVVSVARMQHLPTFKEKVKQYPDHVTMALLNYPVLMAADILAYKSELVPVGIDQEPHLEVAREIARKMNELYGTDFPEPKRFATKGEYVPSLTGEGKMSKTVEGSYIQLADSKEQIANRLAKTPTDSGKGEQVPTSGGVTNLLTLVELFEGKDRRLEYEKNYQSSGISYQQLKEELAQAIYKELQPIQERRAQLSEKYVDQVIAEGAERARAIAKKTVKEVRQKMGLR